MFGHQPQPEQPAPVLTEQRHVVQVEVVQDQLAHPLDVAREGVVLQCERLVRPPEPDHVRRHAPDAGVGEDRDHVPIEERPRRLAMQQERDGSVGGTGVDVRHPQRAAVAVRHLGVRRRPREVRQVGEALVGRAVGLHPASVAVLG